jgi:hypothetical protein
VIKSQDKQISTIARVDGPNVVQDALKILILELARFCNVGKNFNEFQINETVRLIREEYYYLKMDDFKLCFDWIKKGKYGTLYDRLDGAILLQTLITYTDERAMEAEKLVRIKQKEDASNLYEVFNSPALKPVLDKVHKDIKDKLIIKESPKPEPLDPFAQWLELEWDRLYIAQEGQHGYGIIYKYGLFFGRNDWMKYKYAQMTRITKEKC